MGAFTSGLDSFTSLAKMQEAEKILIGGICQSLFRPDVYILLKIYVSVHTGFVKPSVYTSVII
jgi:hypothetical protein